MDMSAIGSLLGSLNTAKDLIGALVGVRDRVLIDRQIAEVSSKLYEASTRATAAQQEHAALLNRIAELEREVMRLTERHHQKEKYQLKDVYLGSFAMVRKTDDDALHSSHWLCQSCFEKGQNFVLQGRLQGQMKTWTCPNCKSEFQTNPQVSPSNPFVPRARS